MNKGTRKIGFALALALIVTTSTEADFSPDPKQIVREQRARWDQLKKNIDRLYVTYSKGTPKEADALMKADMEQCRNGAFSTKLEYGIFDCIQVNALLGRRFYEGSVEKLRKIPSPLIHELLKMAKADQPFPKFGLWLVPFKAGFHRGAGHIAMNLERIHPNEFLFLFIHEQVHAANHQYKKIIEEYRNLKARLETWETFAITDPSRKDLKDPPRLAQPEHRPLLRELLAKGLERGLIEETRAWVVSFAIYLQVEALVKKGGAAPWKPIDWVEAVLAERTADEKKNLDGLKNFVFRYLDHRFEDPAGPGIFKLPLVQLELKEIRREYRTGEREVDFSPFESLLALFQ